jgi:antagonist of KipI
MITTLQSGVLTTIQDQGRFGYQAYGMPIAGAMDQYAFRLANLLAGNREQAAVIEMTGSGAAFKFDKEQIGAVCGADMQGRLNGQPIPNWSAFVIPRGSELQFGTALQGYRGYMAIRGGIAVPPVLQSRSTCTWAKIGGFEGRPLQQGDVLYVGQELGSLRKSLVKVPERYIPVYGEVAVLRVLPGLQDYLFSEAALAAFFANPYTVTTQAERAGYLLEGTKITSAGSKDIVSDAVNLGAVQIPLQGMPLIVTADHPTTRGFAKLGSVIQVDLSRLAQLKPGDKIQFIRTSENEAIQALQERQRVYEELYTVCQKSSE